MTIDKFLKKYNVVKQVNPEKPYIETYVFKFAFWVHKEIGESKEVLRKRISDSLEDMKRLIEIAEDNLKE